jgi:hypothetical protein
MQVEKKYQTSMGSEAHITRLAILYIHIWFWTNANRLGMTQLGAYSE